MFLEKMKPLLMLPAFVWLLGMPIGAQFTDKSGGPTDASPDAVLRSWVESGRIPGVVGVAATGDRVIHQGAFGSLDQDTPDPMGVDTIFAIASMTKPVTSVAVMQLVEQGEIDLEASVADYMPELAHPEVLDGFDDTGSPRLQASKRPPTIRELLSNTSGYAYRFWNNDLLRYSKAEARLPRKPGKFSVPLASEPGTRWEYGPGTAVLGAVVEKLSGLTLEEYFRRHIFAPLGMKDTSYQVPADKWARVARIHRRQADGNVGVSGPKPPDSPPRATEFPGDHGLCSTGPDYLRFVRAFLNGGELDGARILKPETVDLMSRNHIGDLRAGEMISVMPAMSNDVHFFPGGANKFGLGFLLNAKPVPGGRAEGSLMWAGALNTYFWIDRKQGVCGVVMTQLAPFADAAVLEMVEDYEKAVYALPR